MAVVTSPFRFKYSLVLSPSCCPKALNIKSFFRWIFVFCPNRLSQLLVSSTNIRNEMITWLHASPRQAKMEVLSVFLWCTSSVIYFPCFEWFLYETQSRINPWGIKEAILRYGQEFTMIWTTGKFKSWVHFWLYFWVHICVKSWRA